MDSYTKAELAVVRSWVERGMTVMNGRHGVDDGEATRVGSSAVDYVLTNQPRFVRRIEKVDVDAEESDHKLLVVRRKNGNVEDERRKKN